MLILTGIVLLVIGALIACFFRLHRKLLFLFFLVDDIIWALVTSACFIFSEGFGLIAQWFVFTIAFIAEALIIYSIRTPEEIRSDKEREERERSAAASGGGSSWYDPKAYWDGYLYARGHGYPMSGDTRTDEVLYQDALHTVGYENREERNFLDGFRDGMSE